MSSREKHPKVRPSPRMSVQKLGEYVDVVSPSRRERIIHDQKFPAGFIVPRYNDASTAIRSALLSGGDVQESLRAKAALLAGRPAANKHIADNQACCVAAIEAFSRIYPKLKLAGLSPSPAPKLGMVIETLPVSAQPVVLLTRTRTKGSESGGLLLVFRKSAALTERGGKAVAELMRQSLVAAGRANVIPELCIVVDVFSGGVFTAPRSSARLMSDVRSACREITVRWAAIAA